MIREWITNIHRDSYASHIGHYPRLSYMAMAQNESIHKTKFNLLTVKESQFNIF
jgi:splicing factor 3B subunit 5